MSRRARAYLVTAAMRLIVVGVVMMSLDTEVYVGLRSVLPPLGVRALDLWAVAFIGIGVFLGVSAVDGSTRKARIGLQCSVTVTGLWVGSMLFAVLIGSHAGLIGMVVWTSILIQDLLMLADPMRVPAEDPVRTGD